MLTDKPTVMEKETVHIIWQRDPDTYDLLSLHTESGTTVSLGFPLSVFQDADAWYNRMVPEDAGKELLLLNEVFKKGRGKIQYHILGKDGSRWLVRESAEIKIPEGDEKKVLSGEWLCEKK